MDDRSEDRIRVRWRRDRYGCLHISPRDRRLRDAVERYLASVGAQPDDAEIFVQVDHERGSFERAFLSAKQRKLLDRTGEVEARMPLRAYLRLVGHDAREEFCGDNQPSSN